MIRSRSTLASKTGEIYSARGLLKENPYNDYNVKQNIDKNQELYVKKK